MKSTFITGLQHIKITEPLYKGVQLGLGLYVANEPRRIEDLLTDQFVENIGGLEAAYLWKSDAYLYAVRQSTSDTGNPSQVLEEFLGRANLTLTALWLVKDNSVNHDTGFLTASEPDPRYPCSN